MFSKNQNENCLIAKIPPIPLFQRGELQSPPLLEGDLGEFLMLAQCDFDGALI